MRVVIFVVVVSRSGIKIPLVMGFDIVIEMVVLCIFVPEQVLEVSLVDGDLSVRILFVDLGMSFEEFWRCCQVLESALMDDVMVILDVVLGGGVKDQVGHWHAWG